MEESLSMNQRDYPQMVKDKEISKNTGGEMQWPFSSTVFLPPPYNTTNNNKMTPPNHPGQENDQIYSVSAPSLWHRSSVSPALYQNTNNPASLTLLYSGSLHVFHGVSPATVDAIKSIASREHFPMKVETKQSSLAEDIKLEPSNTTEMTSAKFIAGALTMARKATLARFLQKRKYRLTSAKPYQVNDEKKLYRPTPQSPTSNFFNLLPMMLEEEGTGSSSTYS